MPGAAGGEICSSTLRACPRSTRAAHCSAARARPSSRHRARLSRLGGVASVARRTAWPRLQADSRFLSLLQENSSQIVPTESNGPSRRDSDNSSKGLTEQEKVQEPLFTEVGD